jgi:hypothetical protein
MSQQEIIASEMTNLEHVRGEYMTSLEYMRTEDQRGEPVWAAWADAQLQILRGGNGISPGLTEKLNAVIDTVLTERVLERDRLDIEYVREINARAFQRQALNVPYSRYPEGHEDPEVWKETITRIVDGPQLEFLEQDLFWHHIQTNEIQRGIGFLIVNFAFADRLSHTAQVNVELGSSDNLILTALMKGRQFNIEADGHSTAETDWLKAAARQRLPIARGIGVDFMIPEAEWIDACRRPSEIMLDREERAELRRNRPVNLDFFNADFSKHKEMKEFRQDPTYAHLHVDMSGIITSLYMQSPQAQKQALTEQDAMNADVKFVLDYARPDPKNPSRLIVARKIQRKGVQYNLNVSLGDDPDKIWHTLVTFDSGRAKRATVRPYLSKIIAQNSR